MLSYFRKAERRRPTRRGRTLFLVEALETRLALSTTHAAVAPALNAIGYVSGQVENTQTGIGLAHVKVQLVNAANRVESTATTNINGDYVLPVFVSGPITVREVVPKGFKQIAPGFVAVAPTGAFAPGFGNDSWNYTSTNTNPALGPVGPSGWVNIAPAGADGFESPINITTPAINLSKYISINFNPVVPKATINNSHQIQVQLTKSTADTVDVQGDVFKLSQFHYHDPSETTLHGRHDTMEEHFVSTDANGAESVVAVFLKVGKFNAALQPVLNTATQDLNAPNTTTTGPTTPINFAGLLPTNANGTLAMQGWFYRGSLTTPPLSQPVNWFVLQKPITLSAAQLQQYETVAAGSGFLPNNRPIQPLDGRVVNENDWNVTYKVAPLTGLNFEVQPVPL